MARVSLPKRLLLLVLCLFQCINLVEGEDGELGCSVCANRSDPGFNATQPIPFQFQGIQATCGTLPFLVSLFYPSDCTLVRLFGTYCGCEQVPQETLCHLCGDQQRVPLADYDTLLEIDNYPELQTALQLDSVLKQELAKGFTCGMLESALHSLDGAGGTTIGVDNDALCLQGQFRSSACGCSPSWKERTLISAYRISGSISFLASGVIAYNILSQSKKRSSTYHQLILGLSGFDMVSSLAYVGAGLLLPQSSHMLGARGNQATCRLQAFLLQLGLTSIAYNMLLSLYYLFVIHYNWKESRFRKYRRYIHAFVVLLGASCAMGAFPFYGPQIATCLVTFPPYRESVLPTTLFFTVPLMGTLFVMMTTTMWLCITVYQQERKTLKWSARQNLNMTVKVFWMSFYYALSFIGTYPLRFVSNYVEFTKPSHFWALVAIGILAPGQGILNALVYFFRSKGKSKRKPIPTPTKLPRRIVQHEPLHGHQIDPPISNQQVATSDCFRPSPDSSQDQTAETNEAGGDHPDRFEAAADLYRTLMEPSNDLRTEIPTESNDGCCDPSDDEKAIDSSRDELSA